MVGVGALVAGAEGRRLFAFCEHGDSWPASCTHGDAGDCGPSGLSE